MRIAAMIQKLNEVFLFDSLHRQIVFYEGIHCANNTLLLSANSLEKLPIRSNSNLYDSIMPCLLPISAADQLTARYTAIIIWNKCAGVRKDDSFTDWEKILVRKYGDDIRIVKVNYDIHENYSLKMKNELTELFGSLYQSYCKFLVPEW
jgi:hypothetical protein